MKIIIFGITIIIKIMEKYFVTKEEAIALAEIGCRFNTPFYYDRTNGCKGVYGI